MGRVKKPRYICESSMRWILNYRFMIKCSRQAPAPMMQRLINMDDHSEQSLDWTVKQSHLIDKMGWDRWFTATKGPSGFQ